MLTANTIFQAMTRKPNADVIEGLELTVVYDISGDSGGQWTAIIKAGNVYVEDGSVEHADATITMDADDFVAMSQGTLDTMEAFISGKMKVEGDLHAVLKFQQVILGVK